MSEAGPFRTKRPRVTAVACAIIAVVLAGVAVLLLWAGSRDSALVGPAAAAVAITLLCALISALAFRVARPGVDALPTTGPLLLASILTIVAGLTGAGLGFGFGAAQGSAAAIGAGVAVFLASVIVALQGALVHGAASYGP